MMADQLAGQLAGPLAAQVAGPLSTQMAALPMFPTGGWTVPGALAVQRLPANVQQDIARPWYDGPKPAVTPAVLALTQFSMIAPDLSWRHNV